MNIIRFPLAFSFLFLASATASALPRFSLSTGRTCTSCHYNPSGGQLRTGGGTAYAQEDLPFGPWRTTGSDFSGEIAKGIWLGGDYRMQFLQGRENVSGQTFQQMQAALYAGVTVHERVRLYGKIDFANTDYEAWGLVSVIPKMLAVKLGAFLPSFGIRQDDHTIYTRGGNASVLGLQRAGLLFPMNYKDAGIELGFAYENVFNAQAGVFNGGRVYPRFDSAFALVGRAEWTPTINDLRLSLGVSFYHHPLSAADGVGTRSMYGGFAGAGYDRFTLLAEFDIAKNLPGAPADVSSHAYFGELGIRLIDGLDAFARYEGFDPDTGADNNELTRMVFGVQFFPWSFLEIRPEYRANKQKRLSGTDQSPVTVSSNQFLTQFHLWF